MTKDRIKVGDPIIIVDDCIDHVDRALNPMGRFYRHNACTRARPVWCSTSSAAALTV